MFCGMTNFARTLVVPRDLSRAIICNKMMVVWGFLQELRYVDLAFWSVRSARGRLTDRYIIVFVGILLVFILCL